MIQAVYRNGKIQPLEEVPVSWQEGQELVVDVRVGPVLRETIEQWTAEMDAAALLSDEDHDQFMKALEEIERESKVLGRREMEKSAHIFSEDESGPSREAG
jgi:predicted DNA-binding antitoxin AbrB/MazE fold protein